MREAIAINRAVRSRHNEGVSLGDLALLLTLQGRAQEALPLFQQALVIAREIRHRKYEGIHQLDLALCYGALGRWQEAAESWRAGASCLREIGLHAPVESKRSAMREACAKAGVPPLDAPLPA